MKLNIIGVVSFPQKNSFKIVYDSGAYESPKMKTFGVNPREAFCRKGELLDTAVSAIGHTAAVAFDMNRCIDNIIFKE